MVDCRDEVRSGRLEGVCKEIGKESYSRRYFISSVIAFQVLELSFVMHFLQKSNCAGRVSAEKLRYRLREVEVEGIEVMLVLSFSHKLN